MKIWTGFGGEHSARLHIVGEFKTAEDAKEALDLITKLSEIDQDVAERMANSQNFSKEVLDMILELNYGNMAPYHPWQLQFEYHPTLSGKKLEIYTNETAIEAFTTALIFHGAKITIFSDHNSPGLNS